jgi:hypothetical protein
MNLEKAVSAQLMLRYVRKTALLSTNENHPLGESPFALSSAHSGRIEGFVSFICYKWLVFSFLARDDSAAGHIKARE